MKVTPEELEQTRQQIDDVINAYLEANPGIDKMFGIDNVIDMVTNYLLREAFKRLPESYNHVLT
ncbi:hypothetical protein GFM72_21140 [Salmonella enterica]|nr:hypothetical protein [Salmonella enterica]